MTPPSWASEGLPLLIFLFGVVFLRAQATFLLGRAAASGGTKLQSSTGFAAKIANWFSGPIPRKGAAVLERWGILIIPLSFLTVGLQSAVLAGAGLVQMPWPKFTLAMLPGAAVWAALYGFGLLALWSAALAALAGNPWAWVVLAVLAAGLYCILRRRRGAARLSRNAS